MVALSASANAGAPVTAGGPRPQAFHVLAKPTGAICNLDCAYCFFLAKEQLYPGSKFRMADDVLEAYIGQLIAGHAADHVTIAWQGGEPTLMGLDFFRHAMAVAERHRRPGMRFEHTIQTNGTLLDDAWCAFFKEHGFLVGISIDGPAPLHDRYRYDKGGKPTFDKVMRGLRLLQKHGVDFNVLTTVNSANADHPLTVYRFLRDEVGADWMQFIPVVERINADGGNLLQEGDTVSERSVGAEQFGRFLTTIFDEWVRRDVGKVFVQTFEAAARSWLGLSPRMCVFDQTCGLGPALEHNGDLYTCDHFVEPKHKLGNIKDTPIIELVASDKMRRFGQDKRDTLPQYCRACPVLFACNGECPKNRFIATPDGEPGLNYLCAGYMHFFTHIDRPLQLIAGLLRRERPAAEVMALLAREEAAFAHALAKAGRNDPCPCGSGRKLKHCHGASPALAMDGPRAPGSLSAP